MRSRLDFHLVVAMNHEWSTYGCSDYRQQDECLRCDAKRIKGVNSNWKWHYERGGATCEPVIDPAERAVMKWGRE